MQKYHKDLPCLVFKEIGTTLYVCQPIMEKYMYRFYFSRRLFVSTDDNLLHIDNRLVEVKIAGLDNIGCYATIYFSLRSPEFQRKLCDTRKQLNIALCNGKKCSLHLK